MVDLGLIKVFLVIYDTNNISHAAERLNLSQPSVTYNLNRLRRVLNDPLFVRDKFGVKPTKLAQTLHPSFSKAMGDIQEAILSAKTFDPASSTRVFRLGLSDLGEICLLPSLISYLSQYAPSIKIEVEEINSAKVEEWLVSGFIDVAVFNSSYTVMPKVESRNLFEENYVCIAAKTHPRLKALTDLTLDRYLEEQHVAIKSSTGHIEVEQKLKALNVKRSVALKVPHFSVLEQIISHSSYLVTLPSRAAQVYARSGNINIFKLPFDVTPFNVSVNYYNHNDDLEARAWFYQLIQQIFAKL
ncbi:LysR family transcriptional regulator [Psychrobacter immobilis]|uniref:LysR family transcriptional regulator n=1 Tax=Psychrobacter immobilis TaxID=498 RepID=UPI003FD03D7B